MNTVLIHLNSNYPYVQYNLNNIVDNIEEIYIKFIYLSGIGTTTTAFLAFDTVNIVQCYSNTNLNNVVPLILNPTSGIWWWDYRKSFLILDKPIKKATSLNIRVTDVNGNPLTLSNFQIILELKHCN